MLFFKRILNFTKDSAQPTDHRNAPRYPVGPTFPFKSVLSLVAHDDEGSAIPGATGQDWAGRLTNLSSTGASMQLGASAVAIRGEPVGYTMSLDAFSLAIPSTVAFFRCFPHHVICGFSFKFPDFKVQKAYLQLLEPVAIGASLAPRDPKSVRQFTPGLQQEEYTGNNSSLLTVWRQGPWSEIHSFDFRMNAYGVRWSPGMAELETYGISESPAPAKKDGPPLTRKLTEVQQEEVRWLFCLAVPNVAKAVPIDVRKFLGRLVA